MPPPPNQRASARNAAITLAALLAATVAALRAEGRLWYCDCGHVWIWISDVWSHHCSQHPFDPYSLTHLSHGLIFYSALTLLGARISMPWRFVISITIAAGWEVLENSPLIIDRYRTATMSLDYLGDSITNSVGDIVSCGLGFLFARAVGLKWTLAVFILIEIALLVLIRDNLTLNVVMLVWPIQAIKAWQSVGH